jgi:hypothetical protein
MTATVAFVKGKAVLIGAKGLEKNLNVGGKVVEGDVVRLATKDSRLVLKVSDGTELRLKGKTEIHFKQFSQTAKGERKTQLEVAWGSFWAKVAKLTAKRSRFEVKEGGVVCGVRGTVIGGAYDPKTHEGRFFNFEGVVYTDNGQGPQDLPLGHTQPFSGNQYGPQRPNSDEDNRQFQFGTGSVHGNGETSSAPPQQDILGDLTHDLNHAVGTAHNNNTTANGNAQNNSNLKVNLDTPEGTGGGGANY